MYVLAAVLLTVFFASSVRSAVGFGEALIAMPLLAMVVGLPIARPLIAMLSVTIAIAVLIVDWREVNLAAAIRLLIASLPGIPLGFWASGFLPEALVQAALAVVVIGFAGYRIRRQRPAVQRPPLPENALSAPKEAGSTSKRLSSEPRVSVREAASGRHQWPAYPFGFVAGILGAAYNTQGPPLVIYGSIQGWSRDQFRATLQGYFLPSSLLIIISHALAGSIDRTILQYYAASLPVVIVAYLFGSFLARRIPQRRFAHLVHLLLIAIGVSLCIKLAVNFAAAPGL